MSSAVARSAACAADAAVNSNTVTRTDAAFQLMHTLKKPRESSARYPMPLKMWFYWGPDSEPKLKKSSKFGREWPFCHCPHEQA